MALGLQRGPGAPQTTGPRRPGQMVRAALVSRLCINLCSSLCAGFFFFFLKKKTQLQFVCLPSFSGDTGRHLNGSRSLGKEEMALCMAGDRDRAKRLQFLREVGVR